MPAPLKYRDSIPARMDRAKVLRSEGRKYREIAIELDTSIGTISRWLGGKNGHENLGSGAPTGPVPLGLGGGLELSTSDDQQRHHVGGKLVGFEAAKAAQCRRMSMSLASPATVQEDVPEDAAEAMREVFERVAIEHLVKSGRLEAALKAVIMDKGDAGALHVLKQYLDRYLPIRASTEVITQQPQIIKIEIMSPFTPELPPLALVGAS